ncbi:MAG TPA: hypothetical protein VGM71_11830 [Luteibacter sp.]|jgi:hypothetical protein
MQQVLLLNAKNWRAQGALLQPYGTVWKVTISSELRRTPPNWTTPGDRRTLRGVPGVPDPVIR